MLKKIDLLVTINDQVHYLCSTNQSQTCKEAVDKFISKYNQTFYQSTTGTWYINNNVKGYFDYTF